MRHFTVQDAEALIPELERIFSAILDIHAKAEAKLRGLQDAAGSPAADPAQAAIDKAQLEFLAGAVNECLQRIVDLGALPKGVEPALVDFPHQLAGREVYLCWKLGETRITHYHGIEEGFSGRRPLPSRGERPRRRPPH